MGRLPSLLRRLLRASLLLLWPAVAQATTPTVQQIAYGPSPQQFARLHLPAGTGPHPVVVLIHGGCWQKSIADHDYLEPLAAALARESWAVWNIEYSGTDDAGGGFPNTFLDVAAAIDALRELAPQQALDLQRLVFAGHSAGGHLALWAAGRARLPRDSRLHARQPLLPQRVIGLAAITDLASYPQENPVCGAAVPRLRGSARLQEVSPLQMAPLAAPVSLLTGSADAIVPATQAEAYAKAGGAGVSRVELRGDHFDLLDPGEGQRAILTELRRPLR